MSVIDNAIARLQDLALAIPSSDVVIRSAPDYPVESAGVLPLAIAHMVDGSLIATNATVTHLFPTVAVDFHFNRADLKKAYQDIDATIPAYGLRLSGDPTLNGTVDSIVFPVTFAVSAQQWNTVETIMLRFSVPLKTLETPIST